jgi:hypothetical protein
MQKLLAFGTIIDDTLQLLSPHILLHALGIESLTLLRLHVVETGTDPYSRLTLTGLDHEY